MYRFKQIPHLFLTIKQVRNILLLLKFSRCLLLNEEIQVYEMLVFYDLLFQSKNKLANTILKAMLTFSVLLVHKQALK